ncbi:hypothetical protein V6R21_32285 [Limibacter armeniacum]|uniref:hypothetical protein n=1 Tax=Limibacter armeniacum TaxID=466084 RepID=UPI002FE5D184
MAKKKKKNDLVIKQLKFNKPQLRYMIHKFASSISIWGRGTGKSSLIAWLMHLIVQLMPRSKWMLVGRTYSAILSKTLPSTVASLERIGYIKDYHFFIGRKAPKLWDWDEPYEPPAKYDNCIYFYTGTIFQFVSQDGNSSSARGVNSDGIIADEGLELDKDKFDKEVSATNRGNLDYFKHIPLHHGVFIFSSMPYMNQADWLLEYGSYYKDDYQTDIIDIRNEIVDLQIDFLQSKEQEQRLLIWEDIKKLNKLLKYFPSKKGMFYSEASAFDNIQNLGFKYIEQQFRDLPLFIFMIEMLNKRPGKVEGGFYPMLSDRLHTYVAESNFSYLEKLGYNLEALSKRDSRFDTDVDPNKPLIISVDWGSIVSTLPVSQQHGREMRTVNALYVKHPKLTYDLANDFGDYYLAHLKKEVTFIEDHWGNTKSPGSKTTMNDDFVAQLRKRGWRIKRINLGRPALQSEKYQIAHKIFAGNHERIDRWTFNRENCKWLLLSMMQAKVKEGRKGEIQKDKSRERNASVDQRTTTHFSDSWDLQAVAVNKGKITPGSSFVPNG